MHRKKFHFSAAFTKKLIELTEGSISASLFEKILSRLESETLKYFFTTSSEANLIRIFSSIYDLSFFFREIYNFPHHGEILIAISASSNYLTDIVVRNPEYLYQIFDQEYLSKKLGYDFFRSGVDGADRFKSFNSKLNFLRQFKKRLTLKIGLSDILGIDELVTTTERLSFLAKSINAKLFEICYSEILKKYSLQQLPQKYCICSFGKLGGNELNYSSDVDLILFYDFNEMINGTNKDYHELLSEAAHLFIKSSTDITDNGYIYRVDFRLRPDGKFSPLCKTLNDYTKYYETRGESWERQMLIKMNYLCGDAALYNQFGSFVQSYVYQFSHSSPIKERIKQMKLNIERHNTAEGNVKTFSGGIRDIEFSVQSLQMINGDRTKSVRTGNTLNAISALTKKNLLRISESTILSEAYIFYRRIEHFLQLMNDTQTHIITENKELLCKLVAYLNMRSVDAFQKKLKSYRLKIRSIYESILSTDNYDDQNIFTNALFKNALKAERNFFYLRSGVGLVGQKEFDTRTIELFNQIEPVLMKNLKKTADPDKTLDNLVKVIRSTKFQSMWFNEFGNEKYFKNFLQICSYSQKAIDIISMGGSYEEFFLSRKVFIRDSEDLTDYSTTELVLSLSVQYALRLISEKQLSETLSSFIFQKIKLLLDDHKSKYKFFIAGLGSFGSHNMSFNSDIDLIIVADEVETHPDIQKDFQNFITKAKEILKPFEIDFKLRPEGRNSPLVWGIKNYADYLHKRVRVWEIQSLLKLNFVYGNEKLYDDFKKILFNYVELLDPKNSHQEIIKMYSAIHNQAIRVEGSGFSIKKDRGGLLTINFIFQAVCLAHSKIYMKCLGKSSHKLFLSLANEIEREDLVTLKSNYYFQRDTELAIQNIFNSSGSRLPLRTEDRYIISKFLKMKSAEEFEKRFTETIESNNKLFEKYVGR